MHKKVVKARDVMNTKHLELEGMATVMEALNAMKVASASVVIVTKRHEHDAFGIVLLSDIAKKVLARDRSPTRVNVYEIMSKPVISLDPDMDVRYCARLFDRFGLSNVPVIENGKVLGIVSYNDLVFEGLCMLIE
jgi:signal-transduction protein with cAMP-binding, CBS, and nucleotidyltransferase domain